MGVARVLVVDDEKTDLVLHLSIVEKAGHKVYYASDGAQGLRIYLEKNIDVVVTDLRMPKVHGLEFIVALRTLDRKAGIIAVSSTGEGQLAMAEAVGATAALSKPVDPDSLVEAIAKLVPEAAGELVKLVEELGGKREPSPLPVD